MDVGEGRLFVSVVIHGFGIGKDVLRRKRCPPQSGFFEQLIRAEGIRGILINQQAGMFLQATGIKRFVMGDALLDGRIHGVRHCPLKRIDIMRSDGQVYFEAPVRRRIGGEQLLCPLKQFEVVPIVEGVVVGLRQGHQDEPFQLGILDSREEGRSFRVRDSSQGIILRVVGDPAAIVEHLCLLQGSPVVLVPGDRWGDDTVGL